MNHPVVFHKGLYGYRLGRPDMARADNEFTYEGMRIKATMRFLDNRCVPIDWRDLFRMAD